MEATNYYDPPNLTFPFGTYICVVDIDRGTGEVKVRRFVAVDDCGNIINPMIVQGQIHGGLTQGLGPALYEEMTYDEDGNNQAGSFMDYLVPTAVETPAWETGHTITPSPHHPLGAKGGGGVGYGGGAAGDRECGGGRAGAPGRDAYGDSDAAGSGVGGVAGEGGWRNRGIGLQLGYDSFRTLLVAVVGGGFGQGFATPRALLAVRWRSDAAPTGRGKRHQARNDHDSGFEHTHAE